MVVAASVFPYLCFLLPNDEPSHVTVKDKFTVILFAVIASKMSPAMG